MTILQKIVLIFFAFVVSGIIRHGYLSYKYKTSSFDYPDEPLLSEDKMSKPEVDSTLNSIGNKSFYTKVTNMVITPPAAVLQTKGGIGNQLFQYACMYALARKHNWPLYIYAPNSSISDSYRNFTANRRDFALDKFTIPLFGLNILQRWYWGVSYVHFLTDSQLLSGQYPRDRVVQLSGHSYCTSETFFHHYEKELTSILKLKIPTEKIQKYIDVIESKGERSVALHFRQGDILKYTPVPTSFYLKAMEQISKMLKIKPTFFIFSEDGLSAYRKLKSNVTYEKILISYVDLTSLEEFYVMSRCKHFIIPRSSFSWWAAYLSENPGKIVIAAHFDNHTLDIMYGRAPVRYKSYLKWQNAHIFYPTHWYTIGID